MRKQIILSDTERKYKGFDKWSKFLVWPLVVPAVVLGFVLILAEDDAVMLISALLLMGWTAVIVIASSLIAKRRTALEEKLWEERNTVKRTGVFKELYEEFRHDGFEFNICTDKFLFDDCHRNVIEFAFLKNCHEFAVVIDDNTVSIIVDEETDHPIEEELPLTKLNSINHFYAVINEFVQAHS